MSGNTLSDLRYALRTFARRPVFTAAILVSLALGIGANTAVFSILNTLMLRPLPLRDPAALFQVQHSGDLGASTSSTYGLYDHLRTHAKSIDGVLQVRTSMVKVLVDGEADVSFGQQVTGDYFEVLGIQPLIGRLIDARHQPGSTPNRVAVLGHAYWARRFGSDRAVLGRTISIDQVPHTIVGVTHPGFFGLQVGRRVDVSVPVDGSDDRDFWQSRALVVRLASGVSLDAAVADLDVLFQQYVASARSLSDRARAQRFKRLDLVEASTGLPEFRDRYGKPVLAMLALVSVLLLLACANLASLFLARAAARQRDLGLCLALGASRRRLARQLLSETVAISIAGGGLGVLAAWWSVDALVGFLPDFGMPIALQIRPDTTVLLFTLGASVLTGAAIGLAPAWLAGRVDLREMLAAGARTVSLGTGPLKGFIVVQVALSTILVVAATLFLASLTNLKGQPLGAVADGVLMLTLDADGTGLEGHRLGVIQREILEKIQSLPGVQHATFAKIPPLSGNESGKPISIPGVTFPSPDDGVLQVNSVGPNFFETFGVPILKGRGITASDNQAAPQVAVVSESMAQYYFPGIDPIGRRLDVGRGRTGGQIEIVGVAGDMRQRDLRTPAPRMVYLPAFQGEPEERYVFAIRTSGDPAGWTRSVQHEIQTVAAAIPTSQVKTLVRLRDERLVNERLLAAVSACFGALALVLAAIGIYGTVAYSVTQRTAEFGVRMALGATSAGLVWLVLRETLTLILVAVALGVTGALMTSSLLSSFLFGIEPTQPWVYSATVMLLLTIGVLAMVGPTLRASRIDPVDALRAQ